MGTPQNVGESIGQSTISTEGRRVIGQAIMEGILTPGEAIMAVQLNYTQQGGNYTQRGGGNYTQSGGGNYNQAAVALPQLEVPS
jgi:hypothetical protein